MERKSQITIKDIARELGISPSTVSRAMKNHPDISQKTKDSVRDLAEKYHYKPNAVALSLRSSKTHMIGVVIPKVVHFFFSSVISGIEHVANDAGYNVLICQSDENEEREITSIQTLTSSRVDGILASVSKDTTDFTHFKELLENNIPLVFFDRAVSEVNTDKVIIDDCGISDRYLKNNIRAHIEEWQGINENLVWYTFIAHLLLNVIGAISKGKSIFNRGSVD